jgi:hypothetical protein
MCKKSAVTNFTAWSPQRRRSTSTSSIRVGKLQFGVHGALGLATLVLTMGAILWPHFVLGFMVPSQMCILLLVSHATTGALLQQVPHSTQIFPGVVAPHKEAFLRTAWMMQYLAARVIIKCVPQSNNVFTVAQYDYFHAILAPIILAWRGYQLVPKFYSTDWYNGNTWIFVVPMFVGVCADAYQQYRHNDLVDTVDLLAVELSGLLMAFAFTLGFRQHIPMPVVYVGSALCVWSIIQRGFAIILAKI